MTNYKIVKREQKYLVVVPETQAVKGSYDTRPAAVRRVAVLKLSDKSKVKEPYAKTF